MTLNHFSQNRLNGSTLFMVVNEAIEKDAGEDTQHNEKVYMTHSEYAQRQSCYRPFVMGIKLSHQK